MRFKCGGAVQGTERLRLYVEGGRIERQTCLAGLTRRLQWGSLAILAVLVGCDGPPGAGDMGRLGASFYVDEPICPSPSTRSDPALVLGSSGERDDEDDDDWFGSVSDGALLGDGSIAVADGLRRTIHVYDSAGALRTTLGRRGSGPGEFAEIGFVGEWDGGVVAHDRLERRVTTFHGFHHGAPDVEVTRMADPAGRAVGVVAVRRVVLLSSIPAHRAQGSQGVYRDSVELLVVSPGDPAPVSLGRFPGTERISSMEGSFNVRLAPFGRRPSAGVVGGYPFVAPGDAPEMYLFDLATGRAGVVSLPDLSTLVDPQRIEDYLRFEGGDVGAPESFRRQVAEADLPERTPPYREVRADQTGLFWVTEYVAPSEERYRVRVVTPGGEIVEELDWPNGTRFLDADSTRVVRESTGPDGSPRVEVLPRSCGPAPTGSP